jgi:hypothetical protein
MTKRVFAVAAVGIAAVLVAGGLVASNMGFKANYHLDTIGSNGSVTGAQTLALPYNQQTGINTAQDLINDINTDAGAAVVDNVSRIVRTTDLKESYSLSVGGVNFGITPGEGYIVVVTASADYIMVGSHNPALALNLDSPGTNGSNSGTQLWSMPYHFTGTTAQDLINEIESHGAPGDVDSVSSLIRTSVAPQSYSLSVGGTNFPLVPGEAYVIVVLNDVTGWIPSHF